MAATTFIIKEIEVVQTRDALDLSIHLSALSTVLNVLRTVMAFLFVKELVL